MAIDGFSILGILLWTIGIGGLAVFWVAALVSISRRSSQISGLEAVGWYAIVIFAQFFGPLIWFFFGRDRYAPPSAAG